MTKKKLLWLSIGLALIVVACTSKTATTPSPTPKEPTTSKPASPGTSSGVSFAGKTITFVVPYGAGGTTDLFGRMYSRYIAQYLPGKPTITVRNMPGGQMIIGSNYAYASKPDGLTILVAAGGVYIPDVMKMSAAQYEMAKMTGIIGIRAGNLFYVKRGIVDKAEDLPKAKGIVWGHTAATPSWMFVTAKALLDIPTDKVIMAYASGAEATRALLAGEINMSGMSSTGYKADIAQYEAKGEVMPLFQAGLPGEKGKLFRDPIAPPVPTVGELYEKIYGKPPSGMAWEAFQALTAMEGYRFTLFLPPGAPNDIVRTYWDAAGRMVKDAEFVKVAEPLAGKDAEFMTGEPFDKAFKANFGGIKPEVVDWLKSTLKKYDIVVG